MSLARLRRAYAQPWVRTLAVLWFAQVLAEMAFSFALPFLPLYVQELGVQDVTEAAIWAGLMSGLFAVTMAAMGPVWGVVADRYGRRLMIQRAVFGACLVVGAMSLVQSPEQLLVLRTVQGALTGVVAATTTVVSLTAPRQHVATALGLMHAALFVGASLGPILGGLFADSLGLRAAFVATGVLFFLAGVLVTLFVREPPREPAATGAAGGAATAQERLVRRELIVVVALMAVARIGNTAPQPILPLFVQQIAEPGAPLATTVGLVVAATGVASTASALLLGRLTDRYGRRATLLACLGLAIVLSPLHALVGSVGQLLALRTAMGLALGGMVPAIQSLMTDLTPPGRRGAAFGLLATANAIGNGAGPVAGSVVAAAFGVPAVFLATTPVFGAAAWVLTRLRLTAPTRT